MLLIPIKDVNIYAGLAAVRKNRFIVLLQHTTSACAVHFSISTVHFFPNTLDIVPIYLKIIYFIYFSLEYISIWMFNFRSCCW
jgi:hypothetical protein